MTPILLQMQCACTAMSQFVYGETVDSATNKWSHWLAEFPEITGQTGGIARFTGSQWSVVSPVLIDSV